jgi:hypothetical protein
MLDEKSAAAPHLTIFQGRVRIECSAHQPAVSGRILDFHVSGEYIYMRDFKKD